MDYPKLVVAIWAVSATAQGQSLPSVTEGSWTGRLTSAIAAAVEANPDLAAMEARVRAAHHRVGQADALPDPELEIGIIDVPIADPSLSRDDFTMETIGARQTFPGAGKRDARRRFAEAEAEEMSAQHVVHVRSLSADVARSFFGLAEFDARIAILEKSRERLSEAAAAALERYRVGKAAQADVLRANLETTSVEERLATLRGDRRREAASFNALQALAADSPVEAVPLPSEEPRAEPPAKILAAAMETSPALEEAGAQLRRAEEEAKLAKLERRPDFKAYAYYAHRQSFEDLGGASISFNLPFLAPKRLSERAAEAEASLSGARAGLAAARNRIRQEVEQAYADLDRDAAQARLYRDSILPQAETNYAAAAEAYAVGQIDFLTYIRAALDRDAYEGELAIRRAGAWRALADLQSASGLPLIAGTPDSGESHE